MRKIDRIGAVAALAACLALAPTAAGAEDTGALLARIKKVGREGTGNVEASRAARELARSAPAALPAVLAAMDGADETVVNWLRPVAEAIADRALAAKQPLPADRLELFVKDTKHGGRARRLAYELLVRVDPGAPNRLLPGMLNDPAAELRRDAVAEAIVDAEKLPKEQQAAAFRKVFGVARDRDQVDAIAKRLEKLGDKVDVAAHYGFVRQWKLCSAFDNTDGTGYNTPYPPETAVDLKTTYAGKGNKAAAWTDGSTDDPYGKMDLNKIIGKLKACVAYGYAEIVSPTERPVEIRLASYNATKIWLNGKLIFAREEYHHGMRMDQGVAVGTLKAGKNELLIKVCQNDQEENWAQSWIFQLRICDELGAAVPFTVATGKADGEKGGN